jgi:hypothetical protein
MQLQTAQQQRRGAAARPAPATHAWGWMSAFGNPAASALAAGRVATGRPLFAISMMRMRGARRQIMPSAPCPEAEVPGCQVPTLAGRLTTREFFRGGRNAASSEAFARCLPRSPPTPLSLRRRPAPASPGAFLFGRARGDAGEPAAPHPAMVKLLILCTPGTMADAPGRNVRAGLHVGVT